MLPQIVAFCSIFLTWIKIFQCVFDINLAMKFVNENITQDLNITYVPSERCEVRYPNCTPVRPGSLLHAEELLEEPMVRWNADPSAFYTLLMISPDYPCHTWRGFNSLKSWFVGNIPGCDVKKGHVIAEYQKPYSLPFTGPRRWVFFVHKQPDVLNFSREGYINKSWRIFRGCFNYPEIVEHYEFDELVAANYFWTDDGLRDKYEVSG